MARGRIRHARSFDALRRWTRLRLALFERATRLYRLLGDEDGEAESMFWEACFHQVVLHDDTSAVPLLERSRDLAAKMENPCDSG